MLFLLRALEKMYKHFEDSYLVCVRVVDAVTGEPIEGATVAINGVPGEVVLTSQDSTRPLSDPRWMYYHCASTGSEGTVYFALPSLLLNFCDGSVERGPNFWVSAMSPHHGCRHSRVVGYPIIIACVPLNLR